MPGCYSSQCAQFVPYEIATAEPTSREESVTSHVEAAIRALRIVAERPDPTAPLGTGAIAAELGRSASSVSRSCAALARLGLLAHGEAYGSYRLGRAAIRLSGRAAAAVALPVRSALTIAAQTTGETACLAARSGDALHIVASVGSEWTLHAAADVGERVPHGTAIAAAEAGDVASSPGRPRVVESLRGGVVEVASSVLGPDGECVAIVAIRLPTNRSEGGVPRARRAVETARRRIEAMIANAPGPPGGERPPAGRTHLVPAGVSVPALEAAVRILDHLAAGPDSASGIARAAGVPPDRARRLVDSLARAGVVTNRADGRGSILGWGIHGWHRAATGPTLVSAGKALVAEVAADAGVFGFITILRGIRSFTVVEVLGDPTGGLVMMPWLGRPHPVIGSDGGPTLVMEFEPDDLDGLLRKRHSASDLDTLHERIRRVSRDGVISIDSDEDAGLISTSAPIRDASGRVVGAACLTGGTDSILPRRREIEHATRRLADRLSDLVR
jgi:DNA-binding IclR family transcriptional regulator